MRTPCAQPLGMNRRSICEGFTLIELLVVIAIIMILASLLFPTFVRARGVARSVACASNLRQCAIALQMYQDDWDGKYPAQDLAQLTGFFDSASPRSITGPDAAVWVGQIFPYLRNREVMRCQTVNETAVDRFNGIPMGIGLNIQLTSYSVPSGG